MATLLDYETKAGVERRGSQILVNCESEPWLICMSIQWRLSPLSDGSNSPPNTGNCKRRRREAAIAEGKKPLTTRESEGASEAPSAGAGAEPQKSTQF